MKEVFRVIAGILVLGASAAFCLMALDYLGTHTLSPESLAFTIRIGFLAAMSGHYIRLLAGK